MSRRLLTLRRHFAPVSESAVQVACKLLAPLSGRAAPTLTWTQQLAAEREKLGQQLGVAFSLGFCARKRAYCSSNHDFVLGAASTSEPRIDTLGWARVAEPLQAIMHPYLGAHMVDDILVKVDRARMDVSLETRRPLFDPRVVALVWNLPLLLRVGKGGGKLVLRRILARNAPPELAERPKKQFGVLISDWVRGPLRQWAGSLLNEQRVRDEGLRRPEAVTPVLREHLSGWRGHTQRLWTLLVFPAWNQERTECSQRLGA